jgi:hypothetical protein
MGDWLGTGNRVGLRARSEGVLAMREFMPLS